jgi:hypothetical protein
MRRGCLYRFAGILREVANALIGSFTNSTLDGAADCSTVGARGDVHDNFSLVDHSAEATPQS